MKVLAIQTSFSINSGGGRADYEILSELAYLGHDVRVVMPHTNRLNVSLPPGISRDFVYARGLQFPQSLGMVAFPSILRIAYKFQPDIIRDHSPYSYGLMSLLLGKLLSIPVVGMIYHHDEDMPGHKFVEKYLLDRYDHVITISRYSKNVLNSLVPSLSDKLDYIYCGVRPSFSSVKRNTLNWRMNFGISEDEPLFLSSGVLTHRKNHEFLLDVMHLWSKMGRPGKLIITGEGQLLSRLKNKVSALNLEDRVFFVGYQTEQDLVNIMSDSIAFLFPSKMEGFGLAPLEAMSCGTPVIVSDRGALPEVVTDQSNGFVLPIDQGPELWVRAMDMLVNDSGLQESLVKASEGLRDKFSWQKSGRETSDLYKKIVHKHTYSASSL